LSLAIVHVTLNGGKIWRYLHRKFKKTYTRIFTVETSFTFNCRIVLLSSKSKPQY
jgi:hypothetical protein